ncbi:hypothetical protein OC835_007742 [Tilletia horrida]|nr:hypothetical protein OC835_007742 [Tilletia horrida]
MRLPLTLTTAGCATLLILLTSAPDAAQAIQQILIYTGIGPDGFRHDSIPTARKAVRAWGRENGVFEATLSDDPADFDEQDLMQYDALVFISTAGTAIQPKGVKKMRHYIKAGGGFMGVHEATDCMYNVPWYRTLIGTTFNYHPERQQFTADVHHRSHPSVKHLHKTWQITDEIYNFNSDPRHIGNTVVLTADESTYIDPVESKEQRAAEQGSPHPLSWFRQGNLLTGSDPVTHSKHHRRHGSSSHIHRPHVNRGHSIMELLRRADEEEGDDDSGAGSSGGGSGSGSGSGSGTGSGIGNGTLPVVVPIKDSNGPGRSFYTGLGHDDNMWTDDDFLAHVGGAIRWLLNSPTIASNSNATGLPGSEYRGPVSDDSAETYGDEGEDDDTGGAVGYNASAGVAFPVQHGAAAAAVTVSAPVLGLGAAVVALATALFGGSVM